MNGREPFVTILVISENNGNILLDESGSLRSGWRAVVFLFAYVFIYIIYFVASGGLSEAADQIEVRRPSTQAMVVAFSVAAAIALLLGWQCGRLFEKVPFSALGCSFRGNWLGHFAIGGVVGTVAMGGTIIIAVMTGGMTLAVNRTSAGSAITTTLLTTLAVFAVGAASEETLFRGYLLQTFVRSRVAIVGVLVTSGLFAFAHNANPDVSGLALANTLIAGVWFAAAYLKTRDLWFPFGIHLMWNWLQGPVFGINVSGIADFSPDPVLRATDAGPVWLTGGAYGIEGGGACTIALVISIGLIYFLPLGITTESTENTEIRN